MAYRFYISEVERSINNNLAHAFGGTEVKYSYNDIITGRVPKPDNRTESEIINHFKEGLGNFGKEVDDGRIRPAS